MCGERIGEREQSDDLAMLELGRCLAGRGQLLLQRLGAIEDLACQVDGHALAIAEFLREIEDQRVGGFRCRGQRPFGPVALLGRDTPLPRGRAGQHQQCRGSGPGKIKRAPLLPKLLRQQVFLRQAVYGGGEIRGELRKPSVTRIGAVSIGPQIDPFRLALECVLERRRQRGRAVPREVVGARVPGEVSVG